MQLRFVSLLFVLSAACGDDDGGPSRVCDPGVTQACVGAGGCMGGQSCNADGTGYGTCDCGGDPDAGPLPDTGPRLDTGPGPDPDAGPIDAGPSGPCDLVAQTGCPSGERCAWVRTGEMGEARCVAAGSVALHGACARAMEGAPDDCVAGTACLDGTCETICDVGAGCGPDFTCSRYAAFGGDGMVGVCTPTCDPVRQTRDYDGAVACASPDPMSPTRGCYGSANGPFVCQPVLASAATRTHRMVAAGPPSGGSYLNGCAPGYLPLLLRTTGSSEVICVALCDPAETYSGSVANRQGTAPYTCPARGASARTEECRFLSYLSDPGTVLSHEVGFCLDYTQYDYDHDMMPGTPNVDFPSCATLAPPEHLTWGCGPAPAP